MTKDEYLRLVTKIAEGTATDEEIALYNSSFDAFQAGAQTWEEMGLNKDSLQQESLRNFYLRINSDKQRVRRLWPRIAAAASIILLLSAGAYFLFRPKVPAPLQLAHSRHHDIAPIGNKATLTLAGGQQIILDSAGKGQLAQQGGMIIKKGINGSITYTPVNRDNVIAALVYNKLATKGGQYPLVLSDGTKVWLNSSSSITYPVAFAGKERKVFITGEVYFEVAHNAAMPFLVATHGQTVQVLGTHFNINAYDDEPQIKTTLLEGSIKISKGDQQAMLKPGQEARIIMSDNNIKIFDHVDTELATAWKNGLFSYNQTELKEVMKQLARAYEVEVVYDGNVPVRKFTGKIHRDLNASEVLDILKFTKVNFRIEDKKIIVSP